MTGEVTRWLDAVSDGDDGAWDRLVPAVYEELRGIARARLRALRPGETLGATALVHEAYLRLVADDDPSWESRGHFFAAAARSMRNILVDEARRKSRQKRGGSWDRVTLTGRQAPAGLIDVDIIALDEALQRLAEFDRRQYDVVMLRVFGGLTVPEVARILDAAPSTVDRLWSFARAWLHRELTP